MTDKYCVFGNPISHSKSPIIHAEFARQTGQDISYRTLLVPMDGFAGAVDAFIAEGGKGANVTLLFKQEAYLLTTQLTRRAEQAAESFFVWRGVRPNCAPVAELLQSST